MIVDASALVAILTQEPERKSFLKALAREPARVSAATYLETGIVVDRRRDPVISRQLDDLMNEADLTIEPFTPEQAQLARAAYRDFGKGSGHPAGLNFGDCFSYALAKDCGESLLFKGDDFIHTDVLVAPESG